MICRLLLAVFLAVWTAGSAYAAHPLITDDAGTQGKGKTQFEFTGEYGNDREDGVVTNSFVFPLTPVLSYGIADSVDMIVGTPYLHVETKQEGTATTQRGFADISLQAKWRFYEQGGFSMALKPGILLPAGDEDKGLGTGKPSPSLFLIASKNAAPWAFHVNLGYLRKEFNLQADRNANRKNIWHVSFASQVKTSEHLSLVADIGMERNPDRTSGSNPAYVLAGVIYSLTDAIDVDLGLKTGMSRPEMDISYIGGFTWRL